MFEEKLEKTGWVEQPKAEAIALAFTASTPFSLTRLTAVFIISSFVILTLGGISALHNISYVIYLLLFYHIFSRLSIERSCLKCKFLRQPLSYLRLKVVSRFRRYTLFIASIFFHTHSNPSRICSTRL